MEDVGDSWMTPRRCLDLAPVPVAAVKKVSEDEDEDVGCLWKKRGFCSKLRAFIRSSSVCCVDRARVLVQARQSFGGSGLRELACSLFSKMSLDRRLRLQHNPGVIRRAMGLQRRYTILSLFFRLCVPQTFFGHRNVHDHTSTNNSRARPDQARRRRSPYPQRSHQPNESMPAGRPTEAKTTPSGTLATATTATVRGKRGAPKRSPPPPRARARTGPGS